MLTPLFPPREALKAVSDGASELDLVINHPLLHAKSSGAFQQVFDDIKAVRTACPAPIVLKCILETSQLSQEEIVAACVIACEAGADYLKTSTGFCGEGATRLTVALLRWVAERYGGRVKVKASGGIRSKEDVEGMVRAGAQRIGASAGLQIMAEVEGMDKAGKEEGY